MKISILIDKLGYQMKMTNGSKKNKLQKKINDLAQATMWLVIW